MFKISPRDNWVALISIVGGRRILVKLTVVLTTTFTTKLTVNDFWPLASWEFNPIVWVPTAILLMLAWNLVPESLLMDAAKTPSLYMETVDWG